MARSPVFPPRAAKRPHLLTQHGDVRNDDYFWLRDDSRQSPEVLGYLRAENDYCMQTMAPLEQFQQALYDEMVARLPKKESSVPWQRNGYRYRQCFDENAEYPVWQRQPAELNNGDEWRVLLDCNNRAQGGAYYDLGALSISPDNRLMAVTEDRVSRRQYQLHVKDLANDIWLNDAVTDLSGSVVWANDSATFYYVKKHSVTLLPYQVWRHRLGDVAENDELVYQEEDNRFYVGIYKSRSTEFVIIALHSTSTSEAWLLDANDASAVPQCFLEREAQHEYDLDHFQAQFWVRSNRDGKNFGLYCSPETNQDKWAVVQAASHTVMVEDFTLFTHWVVIEERENGLAQLRLVDSRNGRQQRLVFDDPAWVVWTSNNHEPDNEWLRYVYTSMTRPQTVFEMNMRTGERRLLKQQEVFGFDSQHYQSDRIWIDARDGVKVPVSLVWRKDKFTTGQNPLLVYGYGAYGESIDADFSTTRLSLLDRGFVYAIAHVRGGGELGQSWYEQGKLSHKPNTFNDFIDVCEALLARGLGAPDQLYAMGGSAGGLLVGAVANLRPELFRGVLAQVPFVDVVTTMLDESLPLTTGEYEEWGDPHIPEDYWAIKAWSPYDQVTPQVYPHMMVTTGLHDSQVQYWEPAKWVARLRELKTDDHLLLLWTDLDTGHGGKSGRYQYYDTVALECAFLIGLAEQRLG